MNKTIRIMLIIVIAILVGCGNSTANISNNSEYENIQAITCYVNCDTSDMIKVHRGVIGEVCDEYIHFSGGVNEASFMYYGDKYIPSNDDGLPYIKALFSREKYDDIKRKLLEMPIAEYMRSSDENGLILSTVEPYFFIIEYTGNDGKTQTIDCVPDNANEIVEIFYDMVELAIEANENKALR